MKKFNIKKHLPTILTGLGVVGCAAVGISAAKAQKKVDEYNKDLMDRDEMLKVYIKNYWPTVVIFALTSGCIVGSNKLNQKQYQELLKAYTGLGAGFAAYRGAVIEKYGEEVDEELCEEAVAVMQSDTYIDLSLTNSPGKKLLFYEPVSGKYFRAYERDVLLAEYHLNRNFVIGGAVSVSQLLWFLGLSDTADSNRYGWTMEDGYCWVDISHELMNKKLDGEDVYEICYTFPPELDYEDTYYSSADEVPYENETMSYTV